MGVTLSRGPLYRVLSRSESGGFALFAKAHGTAHDPGVVEAAVDRANEVLARDVETRLDTVIGIALSTMPAGQLVFVAECDSRKVLNWWLDELVGALDASGWSGTIALAKQSVTPYDNLDRLPAVLGGVVLPVDIDKVEAERQQHQGRRGWFVDPQTSHDVVEAGVRFVTSTPGDLHLNFGGVQILVDRPTAETVLHQDYARLPGSDLRRIGPDGDVSTVSFNLSGHLFFERGVPGQPLIDNVADIDTMLDELSPVAEYAFIRQGLSPSTGWQTLVSSGKQRMPNTWSSYTASARHIESVKVPDAYAIQYITDDHRRQATDLSAWDLRPAGRLTRVAAKDLTPWFHPDGVDDDTLQQARHDLGPMIMTNADLR